MDVEIEGITAEEAFTLLGNETRMGILRALWETDGPCSFAELRRRVAPDDKGNFSYHLGKLVGHFVRKADDGYSLRYGGEQVVRAILTGTITAAPSIPPRETSERCAFCGATVEMAYERERISVRCTDCGGVIRGDVPDGTYMRYEFPPAGLIDRSREEAIDAAHILYDSKLSPMLKGVCPECAGHVSTEFEICSEHELGESGLCPNCDTRFAVWAHYECDYCQYRRQSVMWFAALSHPTVVAFLHDRGLDEKIPFRKLTGENGAYVRDITETVVDTDPYEFQLTISIEESRLRVLLDETLEILQVDHERADERASRSA